MLIVFDRNNALLHNIYANTTCYTHLGDEQRTKAHSLFAKATTITLQIFCAKLLSWYFLGASTLVRAAMDIDEEIFLTQNTFS